MTEKWKELGDTDWKGQLEDWGWKCIGERSKAVSQWEFQKPLSIPYVNASYTYDTILCDASMWGDVDNTYIPKNSHYLKHPSSYKAISFGSKCKWFDISPVEATVITENMIYKPKNPDECVINKFRIYIRIPLNKDGVELEPILSGPVTYETRGSGHNPPPQHVHICIGTLAGKPWYQINGAFDFIYAQYYHYLPVNPIYTPPGIKIDRIVNRWYKRKFGSKDGLIYVGKEDDYKEIF
jgi:hypothetical protein